MEVWFSRVAVTSLRPYWVTGSSEGWARLCGGLVSIISKSHTGRVNSDTGLQGQVTSTPAPSFVPRTVQPGFWCLEWAMGSSWGGQRGLGPVFSSTKGCRSPHCSHWPCLRAHLPGVLSLSGWG